MAGLMLASPVVFSQVWLFIAPGLYSHEKKLAIPFILMSTVLFVAGAAFGHYIVFPIVWKFFVSLPERLPGLRAAHRAGVLRCTCDWCWRSV